MGKPNILSKWLASTITESNHKQYWHALLQEKDGRRGRILKNLKEYVQAAHDDARANLRDLFGMPSLDPLSCARSLDASLDPAAGYPESLKMNALKGYFGEILAGLLAEEIRPHGRDWKVPVFRFRFHQTAFDELQRSRQTGEMPREVIGQPGSDCLAFELDDDGMVIRCLVCEAKCTAKHRSKAICQAHEKLSQREPVPVDLYQLIAILKSYGDDTVKTEWMLVLQQLWQRSRAGALGSYERLDLAGYVCGQSPVREPGGTWIPIDRPMVDYTGGRRFSAAEIHLEDVDTLIREVYGKEPEDA